MLGDRVRYLKYCSLIRIHFLGPKFFLVFLLVFVFILKRKFFPILVLISEFSFLFLVMLSTFLFFMMCKKNEN